MLKHPQSSAHALTVTVFLLCAGCASQGRPRAVPEGIIPPAESQTSAPAQQKPLSPQQEARRDLEAGNDLMKHGQLDESEHSFRLALEADPGSLDAVAGLGRVASADRNRNFHSGSVRIRDQGRLDKTVRHHDVADILFIKQEKSVRDVRQLLIRDVRGTVRG